MLERLKLLAEGAGAAALAGALKLKDELKGKTVVLVVSGGNIDINLLDRIIGHGLVKVGRLFRVAVDLHDRPGELGKLISAIAATGANVRAIDHDRTRRDVAIGGARVMLELETRGPAHIDTIREQLKASATCSRFQHSADCFVYYVNIDGDAGRPDQFARWLHRLRQILELLLERFHLGRLLGFECRSLARALTLERFAIRPARDCRSLRRSLCTARYIAVFGTYDPEHDGQWNTTPFSNSRYGIVHGSLQSLQMTGTSHASGLNSALDADVAATAAGAAGAATGAGFGAAGAGAAATAAPLAAGASAPPPSLRKRDGASSGNVVSGCNSRARWSSTPSVSRLAGSGMQQSTGHTAAHASWS